MRLKKLIANKFFLHEKEEKLSQKHIASNCTISPLSLWERVRVRANPSHNESEI